MGTISEKLTYLNETKTKLKNVINYAGANITNDTFRSYPEKLYNEFVDFVTNGTDSLYNSLPKVTGEGTELTLNNTANGILKLDFKGNTSQDGEPTPENQQQIHVGTGDNDVKIENRNLFDKDSSFRLGYINTSGTFVNATATACFNQYIPCQPNTNYIISFNKNINSLGAPVYYTINKTFLSRETAVSSVSKRTFTTPENCYYMVIQFNADGLTMTQEKIDDLDCQLVKGSTAPSEYIPHQEQNYRVSLGTLELCKIGEYEDKLFKNTTDNPLYNADLELNKWYKYGAVGKLVLDENTNVILQNNDSFRINANLTSNILRPLNQNIAPNVLSNYLKPITWAETWANKIGFISGNSSTNDFRFRVNANMTLEELQSWLSTHNIIIDYICITPEYTLLDDTLQKQLDEIYYNAVSYEDETNISQTNADLPFVFSASAIKKYSE